MACLTTCVPVPTHCAHAKTGPGLRPSFALLTNQQLHGLSCEVGITEFIYFLGVKVPFFSSVTGALRRELVSKYLGLFFV